MAKLVQAIPASPHASDRTALLVKIHMTDRKKPFEQRVGDFVAGKPPKSGKGRATRAASFRNNEHMS